ncbi:hypothetical protein BBJ29_001616 [Phytophthora kernoviae]|uniref:Uncharacterized protein n=1 Tax=Phytophthora kernoviae TaxID=325452 RepID=A0A3F2RW98_9STRA|nr:hypothetical protein BBJ29_001616 [Phytophthora kernoviae]RLN65503.1 hypothetical protein BBP00_00002789 [Phytophthora kernoviae]
MIVCPVLQQFEFDGSEQVVTRITSEVDLVGGVAASKDQGGSEYILSALHCLIEGFSISNRDQGCDQAKAKSSAKVPFPSKNLLRPAENSDQLLKTSSAISKHIGQYLNIILQEQRRQGGRSGNSIRTVQLSSSLNVSQAAALATAIEACGHASGQVQHKRTKTVSVSPASKDLTPDELKARLREQWRINQANYRKRKCKEELQAMREIEVLHQPAREHKEAANLLPLMKAANMITEEWKKARRREQYLLSQARCRERKRKRLQESQATGRMTKKTGLRSGPKFREVELSITSYECLKAGEHVIIKATGDLRMGIDCEDTKQGGKSQATVCSVLQQFEFEVGEQVMKRITSKVDLVGGVANSQEEVDPERILSTLCCLPEEFCSSSCDNDCCYVVALGRGVNLCF